MSPELFKVLMATGQEDELVITDGNFPSDNLAKRLLRAEGPGKATQSWPRAKRPLMQI
jgi:L-fucose mutarotase/ribose pyranase (RbsD/FucU family)